jgi:hypothetical protein
MAEYPRINLETEGEQLSLIPDSNYLKFIKFHEENPFVYQRLKELAIEWKEAGHDKIGIAMLYEVMRWTAGLKNKDIDGYTLNNNYKAYYARMLMFNESSLRGMFEVRGIKG